MGMAWWLWVCSHWHLLIILYSTWSQVVFDHMNQSFFELPWRRSYWIAPKGQLPPWMVWMFTNVRIGKSAIKLIWGIWRLEKVFSKHTTFLALCSLLGFPAQTCTICELDHSINRLNLGSNSNEPFQTPSSVLSDVSSYPLKGQTLSWLCFSYQKLY